MLDAWKPAFGAVLQALGVRRRLRIRQAKTAADRALVWDLYRRECDELRDRWIALARSAKLARSA